MLMNDLSVTIMYKNLIPPFIMREAGLVVKDTEKSTPRIHLWRITAYIYPSLTFALRCFYMVYYNNY